MLTFGYLIKPPSPGGPVSHREKSRVPARGYKMLLQDLATCSFSNIFLTLPYSLCPHHTRGALLFLTHSRQPPALGPLHELFLRLGTLFWMFTWLLHRLLPVLAHMSPQWSLFSAHHKKSQHPSPTQTRFLYLSSFLAFFPPITTHYHHIRYYTFVIRLSLLSLPIRVSALRRWWILAVLFVAVPPVPRIQQGAIYLWCTVKTWC